MHKNIVWTIAGSDSSGFAGIQADLKTFNRLGVHGCSVITGVTAQSQRQLSDIQFIDIEPQLAVLSADLFPAAIKIGMLGKIPIIHSLHHFLNQYRGKVVLDPVMITTSGGNLFDEELQKYIYQLKKIFKHVDILTPNLPEAEMLLKRSISTHQEIEQAASDILSLGVKSVLIKGGHFKKDCFSQDFWTNGSEFFWLSSQRYQGKNFSGTGCTLSSAIAACCAMGYEIKDAIVIAKMYVNQAMRLSAEEKMLAHVSWPENEIDLPYASYQVLSDLPKHFIKCETALGLYPVVENTEWISKLLPLGITSIQLRIKNKTGIDLENEILEAVQLAKKYNARLFINDHWELAMKCGAYGVHLGQNDLNFAKIADIHKAGLRLGISTHNYYEVARAHVFNPSYIACGPIFPTESKAINFPPQGLDKLNRWCRTLTYPVVAIGGINKEQLSNVLKTGVSGIAMISAITQAPDAIKATKNLLAMVK